jgi:hypothetical protein
MYLLDQFPRRSESFGKRRSSHPVHQQRHPQQLLGRPPGIAMQFEP